MAFEALNHAGSSQTPIIIILNDNGMSISKNVGAISKQLNKIRNNQTYFKIKDEVKYTLNKIPMFGKKISDIIYKTKSHIKHIIVPDKIFEDFGLKYMGPVWT